MAERISPVSPNFRFFEGRVGSYQQVDPVTLRNEQSSTLTKFPEGFFMGVADADYQVQGKAPDAVPTMWDTFLAKRNINPGRGIERYTRWREDINIMKNLGVKEYRTSISMARTIKENGEVNHEAIDWYKKYFEGLNDAGIKIYATLYHWELPDHIANKNPQRYGWKNRETIDPVVKHAKIVADHLDENIEKYFMFNEPWCSTILSHYLGGHPPGERNMGSALQSAHNILVAHGEVFHAIKQVRPDAKIGTVLNMETKYPASDNSKDIKATVYADVFSNTWFSDPLFKGEYPTNDAPQLYKDNMPQIKPGDMELMKVGSQLDSLGINYYASGVVRHAENELAFEKVPVDGEPMSDIFWQRPIYPKGLYDILKQVNDMYKPKRLYVTENGMATLADSKDKINDTRRATFYREHIRETAQAKRDGIPVDGYFAWTLMDNLEWAEGYEQRFGIYHVDIAGGTFKRTPKESAIFVSEIIKNREIR